MVTVSFWHLVKSIMALTVWKHEVHLNSSLDILIQACPRDLFFCSLVIFLLTWSLFLTSCFLGPAVLPRTIVKAIAVLGSCLSQGTLAGKEGLDVRLVLMVFFWLENRQEKKESILLAFFLKRIHPSF